MAGAALINRVLEPLRPRASRWQIADARGRFPAMVLELGSRLQRKTFLFPRVYAGHYLGKPLGRLLLERLRPGDGYIDIGANLGFYTVHAARLVGPRGRVIAFEPDPRTAAALRRTVAYNGLSQVEVVGKALSNHEGALEFHVDPNGLASSLLPEAKARADRYCGAVRVPVTTLDREMAGRPPEPRIRFVKVDVEGAELATVAGMLRSLRAWGCPPVWCEVRGPHGSTRAPNTLDPVADLLRPLGYEVWLWDGEPRPVTSRARNRRGSFDVLFEVPSEAAADAGPENRRL